MARPREAPDLAEVFLGLAFLPPITMLPGIIHTNQSSHNEISYRWVSASPRIVNAKAIRKHRTTVSCRVRGEEEEEEEADGLWAKWISSNESHCQTVA